ncbi:MAG: fimbrillin family protein [Alistipes sp.]|nr:fimbrillin family protein [Alistipes sp.]
MRKVLTIVLSLLVLSGCDHSESIGDARKIGFTSQVNRALVENVHDLQQQQLKLFGAYTLDERTTRVFDAERLYYDASLPGWDYANPQYWIMDAAYRFCAVAPYTIPCTFSDEEGKVTISNFSGNTGCADVLYATAERDLKDNEDFSTVSLRFHHACAAVQFNLINASSQVLKGVRNIRLVGLKNRGDFSFDSTGVVSWVFDGTTIGADDAEQPYGGICTLPGGGLPVNLNVKYPLYDEKALIVLPQTVYKTEITLHLEYIKEGDAEYAVRNIRLGWLDGVRPTEWKAGEKYEYNLTITDNTITAEVIVVDWIDDYVDL